MVMEPASGALSSPKKRHHQTLSFQVVESCKCYTKRKERKTVLPAEETWQEIQTVAVCTTRGEQVDVQTQGNDLWSALHLLVVLDRFGTCQCSRSVRLSLGFQLVWSRACANSQQMPPWSFLYLCSQINVWCNVARNHLREKTDVMKTRLLIACYSTVCWGGGVPKSFMFITA